MQIHIFDDLRELPTAALALYDDVGTGSVFNSAVWLTRVTPAALQAGDRLQLLLVTDDTAQATPLAMLPAVYSRLYGSYPGARVLHFLQREEQMYEPIGPVVDTRAVADCVAKWLCEHSPAFDVVRVNPLSPGQPFLSMIAGALSGNGHWVQLYHHPKGRFAVVSGMTFKDYLAQRPRTLRESLEVNTRLLLQGGRGVFQFANSPELITEAWDRVRYVIQQVPQEAVRDPPAYVAAMLTSAADTGTLRLGLFLLDGAPVAMQFWIVSAGKARCLRIWTVPGQRAFPIDDVLTQLMLLCLIDGDHVDELDFGDVSAEFAQDWAPQERERIGLAAFNRRTWRGVRGAMRHIGAQMVKTAPARLWRLLRGQR